MPWGAGDIGRNVAAVVRDRSLRLVLFAFAIFRPTESAQWIAILVYAYNEGGAAEMGIAAVALLVPAALLAPFVAQIGDRMPRERALALSYIAQGLACEHLGVRAGETISLLCSSACTDARRCHRSLLRALIERAA